MAASPALGCVLLASPYSWHSRLDCVRLLAAGLASILARPPRLCARLYAVGFASPAWLASTLGIGSKAWHCRLACARLRVVMASPRLWHGRLACARLRVVGFASLLARPPRLRSAACRWPCLTFGMAASPPCARLRVAGLTSLLARPPCLRSAACCWPRLSLLAWPPRLCLAACVGVASLAWLARRLVSAQRLGTAASPALGCLLQAPPLTPGTAASPALGCMLLAAPHLRGWPARLSSPHSLSTAALPALGCLLLASPLTPDTAALPALGCLCWPRLTRVVGQRAWSRLQGLALPPRLRPAACC